MLMLFTSCISGAIIQLGWRNLTDSHARAIATWLNLESQTCLTPEASRASSEAVLSSAVVSLSVAVSPKHAARWQKVVPTSNRFYG
jgi:hypothetical protein